jgi:hypothetical protein
MVQQKENEAGLVGIRSLTLVIVPDTIRRIATQSCRYRCEGQNMVLVMILWLLWKAHPGVAICSSFWLSVIWMIRSKNLTDHPSGLVVLLGVLLNAVVTGLNDGVMPVVGMAIHVRPASPIWQPAQASNHLLFLADLAALHFFSIGDLTLIGGTSMLLFAKSRRWLTRQH